MPTKPKLLVYLFETPATTFRLDRVRFSSRRQTRVGNMLTWMTIIRLPSQMLLSEFMFDDAL